MSVRQDASNSLETTRAAEAFELDDGSRAEIGLQFRSDTHMRCTGLATAFPLFSPDDRSGEGYPKQYLQ